MLEAPHAGDLEARSERIDGGVERVSTVRLAERVAENVQKLLDGLPEASAVFNVIKTEEGASVEARTPEEMLFARAQRLCEGLAGEKERLSALAEDAGRTPEERRQAFVMLKIVAFLEDAVRSYEKLCALRADAVHVVGIEAGEEVARIVADMGAKLGVVVQREGANDDWYAQVA